MGKAWLISGVGFTVMPLCFALAGCGVEGPQEQVEDEEAVEVEGDALSSEVLAVDVSKTVDRGLFGGKWDYSYPVGGGTILRHEFHVTTRGHADANLVSLDSNEAKVHAWADLFSGFDFTLKVWVDR